MKHILCILLAIVSLSSFGQSNTGQVVVYSETGEKFRVYLNGELMNEDPRANVLLTGLTSEIYQAKIDFLDAANADFSTDFFAVKMGMEITYRIKWTKKGYAMRYFSERPLAGTPMMEFQEAESLPSTPNMVEPDPTPSTTPPPIKKVTTTSTTTTTTQHPNTPTSENVNMNINMNGVNVGVKVQSNAQTTSSSQTTTTTTTTTTTNSQEHHTTPHHSLPNRPPDVSSPPSCFMAIGEFNQAKESISKKSFSDSKMILAKQMTESHCFTSLQIKEITALFDFETDRLSYATFAYDYCADKQNYYVVNDAFQFESTIDELNKKITKKK